MKSRQINCPNCSQPLSPFFIWVKQVRLNRFKCNNCGSFSEFENGKMPIWLNILSLLTFIGTADIFVRLTGSWIGLIIPVFIFLLLGFYLHLYFCKHKKLITLAK